MLLSKLKIVTAMMLVSIGLASGFRLLIHGAAVAQQEQAAKAPPKKENDQGPIKSPKKNVNGNGNNDAAKVKPKSDHERLQGTWKLVKSRMFGRDEVIDDSSPHALLLAFAGDKVEYQTRATLTEGDFKLDPAKNFLDLSLGRWGPKVLYQFEGDKLLITFRNGRGGRPDGKTADNDKYVKTFERVKAPDNSVKVEPEAARAAAMKRNRLICGENMHRIVQASHDYHDVHGSLPPATTTDPAGKPLLSWRVALLPYLGEMELYKQFHQDEPWDSEHNHKLLAKMPKIYASLGNPPKVAHGTFYQVFVGGGTLFEPAMKIELRKVNVGTVNVLALVTAPDAVPWTKPADLVHEPGKKLPSLVGGMFDDGLVSFAAADSSVYIVPNTIEDRILRQLIIRESDLRDDGEPNDLPELLKKIGK